MPGKPDVEHDNFRKRGPRGVKTGDPVLGGGEFHVEHA